MITLQQLLTPASEAEALQLCLDELTALGFSANSWQEGSRQRTIVQLFARLYSRLTSTIATLAGAGFNETAVDGWLEVFSRSHYDNEVRAAVTTRGTVSLVASATAPGPQSITAGQLVFADSVNGYTYRNRFAFTLTPSTTHAVEIEAEVAAANRDVPTGTITIVKTPIAGVTVNNPALGLTGTWITRNGADVESNATLRTRNRTKWATLGIAPGMAYAHYALQAHESVRRVFVDDQNPRGPGSVDIYVAGDSGDLAELVVDAVDDYMRGVTDGLDKVGTGADLEVHSAEEVEVPVEGSVYILAPYNTEATHEAIEAAIAAYFQALPIGGTRNTAGGQGFVALASLYTAIMSVSGVQNVAFSAPTSNHFLSSSEVAVPAIDLSYYPV